MEFIETPIFTRLVVELLTDDEYRTVQLTLMERPEQGDIIKGSGDFGKSGSQPKAKGKAAGRG